MIKHIDEYRDKDRVKSIIQKIVDLSKTPVRFMEVCGGHTMAIQKFGIPSLLPEQIKLVSGPGCPVCVTAIDFIDHAIAICRLPKTIVCTFGDLMRVPGTSSTLSYEKSKGADVRIILSPLDSVRIALEDPGKTIVFLGIGFETTAPGTALAIKKAGEEGLNNFFLLSAHKIMPPAMQALIDDDIDIQGFLAPGHVSAVTGAGIYQFISEKHKIPVAISGFEPVDILLAILNLVEMVETGKPEVKNMYRRAVRQEGNPKAQKIMEEVFMKTEAWWRGLGRIPQSGLSLKGSHRKFDASLGLEYTPETSREPAGCICGSVLKGLKKPDDCPLFSTTCQPQNPVGACMVSNEGACQAAYKYRRI